jgi:hypothetical protein
MKSLAPLLALAAAYGSEFPTELAKQLRIGKRKSVTRSERDVRRKAKKKARASRKDNRA